MEHAAAGDVPRESLDFVKLPEDEKGLHWGLYDTGELVSVISVFEKGGQVQFRKFATRTALQGKGYGTALLQYVMDWAQRKGKRSIWCNARLTATGIYKRFGMLATGTTWRKYGIEFIKMENSYNTLCRSFPLLILLTVNACGLHRAITSKRKYTMKTRWK
ncbi:GNAT family N-acetyltransferase [Paraflavitalea speifideaquila]|uniref:GNAT family N-acetyltransferase n=1 Tax=Paraflavitalea speifideaquila TaxID=3076558 RepID=UPI0028F0BEDC|nr:GNAT family N-acetyltransferase [Paraflavitalea speifideiaquila]